MLPHQHFENRVLRDHIAQAKWAELTDTDRDTISFAFETVIRPELWRERIHPIGVARTPRGRRLYRFMMVLDFGELIFVIAEGRGVKIALIDFSIDDALLRVAQRCSVDPN